MLTDRALTRPAGDDSALVYVSTLTGIPAGVLDQENVRSNGAATRCPHLRRTPTRLVRESDKGRLRVPQSSRPDQPYQSNSDPRGWFAVQASNFDVVTS